MGQAGVRAQLIEADDADVAWLGGDLLDGILDEPPTHLADGARPVAPEGSGDPGLQQRCRDHEHDQGVIHLVRVRARPEIGALSICGGGDHQAARPGVEA